MIDTNSVQGQEDSSLYEYAKRQKGHTSMMKQADQRNLTMVMDLYELTMANGYFNDGDMETRVAFDVFYRKNPDRGGFTIFAGLERSVGGWGGVRFFCGGFADCLSSFLHSLPPTTTKRPLYRLLFPKKKTT